jgi:hypothetical protein
MSALKEGGNHVRRIQSIQIMVCFAVTIVASAIDIARAQYFGTSSTLHSSEQPDDPIIEGQTYSELDSVVNGAPAFAETTTFGDAFGVLATDEDSNVRAAQNCELAACDELHHRWYAQAESLFFWRNSPRSELDGGVGPQLTLGFRTSPHSAWEGKYFSLLGMDGEPFRTFIMYLDTSGYTTSTYEPTPIYQFTVKGKYATDLHNAEVNYVYTFQRLSVLAGFRFVRLEEEYSNGYESQVENNLYGAQIGLRWRQQYRRLFWEATGKAGIFGNDASGFNSDGYYPGLRVNYETTAAFVSDLNLTAGMQLSKHWGIRGGYNTMWINQVVLAQRNYTFDNVVLLHGANVGLEAQW